MSRPISRSKRWRGGGGPRACRRSRSPGDRSRMPAIWRSARRPATRWRAGSAPSRCRRRRPWRRCRRCSPSDLPVVAFAETSWNEARRFLPILAAPLFADSGADEAGLPRDDSLIERLAGLEPDEAAGAAQDRDRRGSGKHPAAAGRRGRPAAAALGDGHGFADGGRASPGARKPAADRSAADVARRGHQRRVDRDAARQRRRGAAARPARC